ncbi:hypothetical protein CEXT_443051 [Caerostris extrusa]|uniref:Uncharacterized protein n=1 Tax=Caerostris extrusa TaxID=172846 RepID=A0AAV4NTF2_CAEEX|nr:hypothetical protein CEXT_443051 [Caerostris extrusa]
MPSNCLLQMADPDPVITGNSDPVIGQFYFFSIRINSCTFCGKKGLFKSARTCYTKCNRQKSISFVQNILSDASFSERVPSRVWRMSSRNTDPEHPKNNWSVNGILQDRITRMWIAQKKKKAIKISAYRKLLIPQGQREPFGHAVIDFNVEK